MSTPRFMLLPGKEPHLSILQIHVTTADPIEWLERSRDALSCFLTIGGHVPDALGLQTVRSYAITLLTSLYPLRSQFVAGVEPMGQPPAMTENGGVWFTGEGVAIRFPNGFTFEELHSTTRSLLDLASTCGTQFTDWFRADFFALVDALLPTNEDAAQINNAKAEMPAGYNFDKHEQGFLSDLSGPLPRRAASLKKALVGMEGAINTRFFHALAHLGNAGKISLEAECFIMDYVATGCAPLPGETYGGD